MINTVEKVQAFRSKRGTLHASYRECTEDNVRFFLDRIFPDEAGHDYIFDCLISPERIKETKELAKWLLEL